MKKIQIFENEYSEIDIYLALEFRKRFARTLHDEIAQSLSFQKLMVEKILHKIDIDVIESKSILKRLNDLQIETFEDLRKIMDRSVDSWGQGLNFDLESVIEYYIKNWNVDIDLSICKPIEENETLNGAIIRITREAIHNSVVHGKASYIKVLLRQKDHSIQLEIKDNGVGFDEGSIKYRFGIISSRRQAESLGGTYSIESAIKSGTKVEVLLPIPTASSDS